MRNNLYILLLKNINNIQIYCILLVKNLYQDNNHQRLSIVLRLIYSLWKYHIKCSQFMCYTLSIQVLQMSTTKVLMLHLDSNLSLRYRLKRLYLKHNVVSYCKLCKLLLKSKLCTLVKFGVRYTYRKGFHFLKWMS